MPSFRQRPLTWLFFIATACINVVGLASDREATWFDAVALGQIVVAGAWLVLGQSHRLARAAVFVAAIEAIALPDVLADRRRSFIVEGPYVLGAVVAWGAAAAAFTALWQWLGHAALAGTSPRSTHKLRYPLAEILGWMTIVAVVAATLPRANFRYLLNVNYDVFFGLVFLAAITCAVTLSLGNIGQAAWRKGIAESAWLILFVVILFASPAVAGPRGRRSMFMDPEALLTCLYVGTWTLTQILDAGRERSASPLRLHAEPSRDE